MWNLGIKIKDIAEALSIPVYLVTYDIRTGRKNDVQLEKRHNKSSNIIVTAKEAKPTLLFQYPH